MKIRWLSLAVIAMSSLTSVTFASGPYKVVQKLKIGGEGGWDYVTVDSDRHLVFLTRSNHVMVLNGTSGKVIADIPGQQRDHGVALVPAAGRGFISDGSDGSIFIFDLKTYAVLGKVMAEPDADGIVYDRASDRVLVVSGDSGSLYSFSPTIDPHGGQVTAKVELGGTPEFFVSDGQGRVYVNLVNKDEIAVVDSRAMKVVARWPTAPGGAPTGIAIDADTHRLFIGCRNPEKLVVMDNRDGKVLGTFPIGAGNDAVVFDDGKAFASCRDGSLAVVQEKTPDRFELLQNVKTEFGARTLGVDTRTHRLYLPTAEFSPAPTATQERPHPRPLIVPGTFSVLVVGK